jgi:hypothetical protein
MFAFLLLLFVLLVIYYFTVSIEGFNPMNTSPSHVVNIPVSAIPAILPPATIGSSDSKIQDNVKPSDMPGQLPHAQYDQIAASSPLPYQDTTLIKANRQQMINLLEMLKGFLAYEAQEIAERSDPSIQLPLQTARSDFQSLQNEVQVLNRNPGIQPMVTLSHLNDIASNLAYLQEKVRLIGAAGPIQGPIYQFTKPVEGFEDAPVAISQPVPRSRALPSTTAPVADIASLQSINNLLQLQTTALQELKNDARSTTEDKEALELSTLALQSVLKGEIPNVYKTEQIAQLTNQMELGLKELEADKKLNGANIAPANIAPANIAPANIAPANIAPANSTQPSVVPTLNTNSSPAPVNGLNKKSNGDNVSLKDLNDAIVRMDAESMRLSASGTYDPEIEARIVAIAGAKSQFQDLIQAVQNGAISESEIKITKKELDGLFPALGNLSQPIPQVIQSMGLPAGLANMFPASIQNDPASVKEIGKLADKYLDTILNGISASFQVKYTAPREAEIAYQLSDVASLMSESIVKGARGQLNGAANGAVSQQNGKLNHRDRSTIDKTGFPSAADLDNVSNAKFTPMDKGMPITDRLAPLPSDAGRGPSQFDWKQRSKDIENQVRKRGLKPEDFGIMPPNTKVSEGFSWKGYARMICNRLQTTMDPSLPQTCGCPPLDWPGWRIAK